MTLFPEQRPHTTLQRPQTTPARPHEHGGFEDARLGALQLRMTGLRAFGAFNPNKFQTPLNEPEAAPPAPTPVPTTVPFPPPAIVSPPPDLVLCARPWESSRSRGSWKEDSRLRDRLDSREGLMPPEAGGATLPPWSIAPPTSRHAGGSAGRARAS